ncbi:MAG TPA: hypothetical protein VIM86_17225 [Thermodesulfobacteriota bacterium]
MLPVPRRCAAVRALGTACVAAALTAVLVAPAHAAPNSRYPDRFSLRVAGFFVRDNDVELRIDSQRSGLGTTISANQLLGMPQDDDVLRVDGYFRLASRHRIDFAWYRVEFEGTRTLQENIRVGDSTFSIDETIESFLRVNTYKLAYSYSFYRNDKVELGLSLGAHVQDLKVHLDRIGTPEVEDDQLTAPLPVFGFRLDYAITPRLTARGRIELFVIEYDRYSGSLTDFEVDLEYRLFRNLGIGIGFNTYQLDLQSDGGDLRGMVDYRFYGGLAFATLYL